MLVKYINYINSQLNNIKKIKINYLVYLNKIDFMYFHSIRLKSNYKNLIYICRKDIINKIFIYRL